MILMIFLRYWFNFKILIQNIIYFINNRYIKQIILEIDKSLNAFETTAEILSKKKDFQEFLKSHCRIRHYSFQVKILLLFPFFIFIYILDSINLTIRVYYFID